MAEKENTETTPPIYPALNVAVHDAYSNNSEIIIGASDVSIAFLQDLGFSGVQKALVRISMTHEVFLNFVTYCNTRAKFIQDAYSEDLPSLMSKERTAEEIDKSYTDMMSKRRVVARFNFEDE